MSSDEEASKPVSKKRKEACELKDLRDKYKSLKSDVEYLEKRTERMIGSMSMCTEQLKYLTDSCATSSKSHTALTEVLQLLVDRMNRYELANLKSDPVIKIEEK